MLDPDPGDASSVGRRTRRVPDPSLKGLEPELSELDEVVGVVRIHAARAADRIEQLAIMTQIGRPTAPDHANLSCSCMGTTGGSRRWRSVVRLFGRRDGGGLLVGYLRWPT